MARRKNLREYLKSLEKDTNGSLIEAPDFLTLLHNFDKSELSKLVGDKKAVDFDKNLILSILKQRNCDGLRMYFSLKDPNDLSSFTLSIVGFKRNANDLLFFNKKDSTKGLELANLKLSTKVAEDGTGQPPKNPLTATLIQLPTVLKFKKLLIDKGILK